MARNNNNRRQPWKRERKTIHNQHKPFNPDKYGKLWKTIEWRLTDNEHVIEPATQTTIGSLLIDGKKHEITFTEANKIIDLLNDAKHQFNVASRMGMIGKDRGTY
jgi:hypothetical protein